MSSIYRKGRDGYFYYQTYVYNKNTGKKDKRIFHSLGTKNESKARELQVAYDNNYEKKQKNANRAFKLLQNNYRIIIPIIIIAFSTFFMNEYVRNTKVVVVDNNDYLSDLEIEQNDLPKPEFPIDSVFSLKDDLEKISPSSAPLEKSIKNPKPINRQEAIPDYDIEKFEILSSTFGQCLINVLVDANESSSSQKKLCQHLTKKYAEFSNIIIGIYSDNEIGKQLASGSIRSATSNEQKKAWLAMYTYNKVEGEYYNDNPTGHLGGY